MKLSKAKNKLLLNHCFWGMLLLRLKFVEDRNCDPPTLWTDGETVGYHPDFIDSLPYTQIMGVLVHELFHCIMKHHIRIQDRNPKRWNRACDYAINPMIKEAGFDLPDFALDKPEYHGMSAEQIYVLLPEEEDNDTQRVLDTIKPTSKPAAQSEQEWDIATASASKAAKLKGDLTAVLKRIIKEAVEPKISWRAMLREFMTFPKKDDYSLRRPNRRFVTSGLYLPELYSLGLGTVILVKDTSGSITAAEDAVFNTEINMIMEDTRPDKIYMMYCDTELHGKPDEFDAADLPFTIRPIAGGGTDFTAPFTWIEENGINPAVFIYFTDMEGGCSAPAPDYPVMWLSTRKHQEAEFGEVVYMDG